jgi:hypothetical protein
MIASGLGGYRIGGASLAIISFLLRFAGEGAFGSLRRGVPEDKFK